MMKTTDSILAVLASTGVILEAGPTDYFKKKSPMSSKSQAQPQAWQQAGGRRQEAGGRRQEAWQEAGGRRRGRAPRRRQEEPFEIPLRNRYQQGNY